MNRTTRKEYVDELDALLEDSSVQGDPAMTAGEPGFDVLVHSQTTSARPSVHSRRPRWRHVL